MSEQQDMDKYIKQFQTVLGLRDQGRMAEAVALCRGFVDSAPPIGEGWNLVASAAQQMGDHATAIRAAELFALDAPGTASRQMFLAGIMGETPRIAEAADLANRNIEAHQDIADMNFLAGLLNARAGRFQTAEEHFRAAIKCDPHHGRSWEYLANISGMIIGSDELLEMERLEKDDRFPTDEDRVALQYALGKSCHDLWNYEAAWKRFKEGARLVRKENAINLDALEAYLGRLKRRFSKAYIQSFEGMGSISQRPIFIVGMPFSGTRLIERLLASLDNVRAGGDLPFIRLATQPLRNMEQDEIEGFLDQVKEASDGLMDPWTNLANNYLSLLGEFFGPDRHVTDRHLGNYLFIGAIRLLFPDARIIYARRDPLDTALACFATRFATGNHWSYRFEDIAHYARLYQDLMAHWQGLFPESILLIDYEDLVANPEEQAARLIAHCRLEGAVDLGDQHIKESLRAAAGEDANQKPVPFAAIGVRKHYRKWLEPQLSHFATGPQLV